ncbi:MAG: GGDEF domain-containing protein [Actinomycetes bacterium]
MRGDAVSEPISPRLRWPLIFSALTFAFTLALLPIADILLSARPAFLPAVLAVVFVFHLISLCLLVGDYRDRGDPRILATCAGYLAALLLITAYALTLPQVVFTDPWWESSPSVSPYLYLLWHVAFPLAVGLAWAPWPTRWTLPNDRGARVRLLVLTLGATCTVSAAMIISCIAFADAWPSLGEGLEKSPLANSAGPFVIPVLAVVLLLSWDGVKGRDGPERWVPAAVLLCLCDLVLASVESSPYTVGWYASRTLSMLTGGILVAAMLATFRRMKATAEYLAAFDSLTGLPNRRNTQDVLRRMVARAERSDSPLSVISLKIDQLDDIRLRQGTVVADAVIVAAAERLQQTLRKGDTPARLDQDHFLVLLPDSDMRAGVLVAERLRIALACLNVRSAGQRISASLGVATLRQGDTDIGSLLQRADEALDDAERKGHNKVGVEPDLVTDRPPSEGWLPEDRLPV